MLLSDATLNFKVLPRSGSTFQLVAVRELLRRNIGLIWIGEAERGYRVTVALLIVGVNTLLIIFFQLLFLFWEESQQQVSVLVLCLEDVLFDYHDGLNYLRHYRLLELDELGHLFTCFSLDLMVSVLLLTL